MSRVRARVSCVRTRFRDGCLIPFLSYNVYRLNLKESSP